MRIYAQTAVLLCVAAAIAVQATAAGLVPDGFDPAKWPGPMPAAEMAKLAPLVKQMEEAMARLDKDGVVAAVENLKRAHGKYVGVPEVCPEYVKPVNAKQPDLPRVVGLWENSFERMKGQNAWERAPALDAEHQTADRLRVSLRHARAYLQSHDAGLDNKIEFRNYAVKGFDYIAACQGSNGCFGYPYHPGGGGLKKGAADMVAKLVAAGKPLDEIVERGWIVNDFDQSGGGLQFDNGVCGVGLLYAYAETGDEKYLQGARQAGEWAVAQPVVRNFNYNCFSGQLLARLYRVTGDQKYLDAARQKFEVGVLPGQMDNGRWFDQHNARIQYHSVMLRALIDYYHALTQASEPGAERVKNAITLGLDNLAGQINTYGASNIHEMLSLDALVLGLLAFGDHAHWERAANVCVNAICDVALPQLEQHRMPMTETVASYILYRKVKEGEADALETVARLGRNREAN